MNTFLFYLEGSIVFLIMVCVLVAAHELGHYLFARAFGMGVEEFAIGMGKKLKIWRRTRTQTPVPEDYVHDANAMSAGLSLEGGSIARTDSRVIDTPEGRVLEETTEFTFRMLPVGGFVRIKGMVPQDDGSEVNIPGGFYNKPTWQRLAVLFAGPLFSVVAGMLLLLGVYMTAGIDLPDNRPVLGKDMVEVADGKTQAAFAAGLRPGDRIVSVDGTPIATFYQFISAVQSHPNQKLAIVYRRGEIDHQTTLVPDLGDVMHYRPDMQPTMDSAPGGKIGILIPQRHVVLSLAQALGQVSQVPSEAFESIARLVAKPARVKTETGSALTMFLVTGEAAQQGLGSLIAVAAWISISVGIMNLLPFPPLDGGQMLMAFLELLRGGKRLSINFQSALTSAGMVALLVLVSTVVFFDVSRHVDSAGKPPPKTVPTADAKR